ncbi:MAG: hypothetical protein IIZ47_07235 [Erysipelotrichaceae bacterium]|nr:hypothetical protein [Erysipelotrichaceae bacterium]
MKFFTILAIIFGVLAAVSLIYLFLTITSGNRIEKELVELLAQRDFSAFEKLLADPRTVKYVRPYNLDILRLNAAVMKGDKKKIDEAFDRFDNARLNAAQQEAVYTQAFEYYQAIGDKKKVKKYHGLIMGMNSKDDSLKNSIDRMYDIYQKGGYRYLEDTLEELEGANEDLMPILEGMIASMYKNKGDMKKYQEYRDLAEKHLKEVKEDDHGPDAD